MSNHTWKATLKPLIAEGLAREIDVFEQQIELRKLGKLDETLFGETRLRRGTYGQRYDNGQRHNGVKSQTIPFPSGDLVKGPHTMWDAPGMQRIKIPYGWLTPDQMDELANLSEEYSDEICHITTRQDIQLHFIHIDDTPTIMRRLAAVGITTREACGNSVRNTTACQFSGVCKTESFDVTPYAHALTHYLLGHDDCQDFGRKFKIAFSGCADQACGLTTIHDLGFIARVRTVDGKKERGFEMVVGGGLGAVPHTARLFADFIPEAELMPISLACCRVFARLGQKRNRAKARMKFVVKKLGIEEFVRVVNEERQSLRDDPRWTAYLDTIDHLDEEPLKPASSLVRIRPSKTEPDAFAAWRDTNARPQKQPKYSVVTVTCPLGDLSADQMRGLADVARKYTKGTVRLTVEQNLVLRWIADGDLPSVYDDLTALGLNTPGAGTLVDVTACPGTDTCKLGIASSRGLAAHLSEFLAQTNLTLDEAVKNLRIKVSGCFNSCGQHHIADIGFWGVSRKLNGYTVPHFQAVLGGQWSHNAKSYGLAIGAVPSRNVPQAIVTLVEHYVANRERGESYQDYVARVGKTTIRAALAELMKVPAYEEDKSYYSDWGDPREFSIGDLGIGECAGAVVSFVQFGLAASEQEVFEAQRILDGGDPGAATARAYSAMLQAAKALTKGYEPNLSDDQAEIVSAFREHLFATKRFYDPFAKGKFGNYLFQAHDAAGDNDSTADDARQNIEEAQLFIEAAHSCYGRLLESGEIS